MVENLTRSAVLKDQLSSAANDLFSKVDSTVRSAIGAQKPTEDAPVNYKVTHKGGALVRDGVRTSSTQVHQLNTGEVVCVVEVSGRRARIVHPVAGWVSTETQDGVQIMKPCTLQGKSKKRRSIPEQFRAKVFKVESRKEFT